MTTATKAEWTPDDDAVAALIPTRTANAAGETQGSFTEVTRPTQAQVYEVINDIVSEVAGFVGPIPKVPAGDDPTGETLVDMARRVVTLGAASQVELTFYPDHGMSAFAPGEKLFERYQLALKALRTACQAINSGQAIGGTDSPAPVYSFPDVADIPTQASRITTYAERF